MSYPVKTWENALRAYRNGYKKADINEMYNLRVNTLRTWKKLEEKTGSLERRALNRKEYKIDRKKLLEYYQQNSLNTNQEAATAFNCSVSGIRSAKKVLKITRKKDHSRYRTQ